jgi:hypothetical protein
MNNADTGLGGLSINSRSFILILAAKTETPVYYTTAYEIRIVKALCAFIAANGITCKKRNRRIIIALGSGIPGLLATLDWRLETGLVLFCPLLTVAAALWCLHRDKEKTGGDYAAFPKDGFDHTWFDFVVEDIGQYPVWFPRDMGSGKRDCLSGKIVETGMGLHHKYRGIVVAKLEASSDFYLCPLASLVPNPAMKRREPVEIAARTEDNPCAVTLLLA